jgi:hypothetical protein
VGTASTPQWQLSVGPPACDQSVTSPASTRLPLPACAHCTLLGTQIPRVQVQHSIPYCQKASGGVAHRPTALRRHQTSLVRVRERRIPPINHIYSPVDASSHTRWLSALLLLLLPHSKNRLHRSGFEAGIEIRISNRCIIRIHYSLDQAPPSQFDIVLRARRWTRRPPHPVHFLLTTLHYYLDQLLVSNTVPYILLLNVHLCRLDLLTTLPDPTDDHRHSLTHLTLWHNLY